MKESISKQKKVEGNGKRITNNAIRPDGCDEIVAIIKKYHLNKVELAKVIGLNNGSFSDKFRLKRWAKFTEEQKNTLTSFLISMGKELISVNNL